MNQQPQIPIKVYSRTDLHAIRKLVRDETYKWINAQTDRDVLVALQRAFEQHSIILAETDRKLLSDLIGDEKRWGGKRVRKEARNFVKSVVEVIRVQPLDKLLESAIPAKREEFDEKLYGEAKARVKELAEKLVAAKIRIKKAAEEHAAAVCHAHKEQIEEIKRVVSEQTRAAAEEFARKEQMNIRSEMMAERHMLELALKRQNEIAEVIDGM